MLRYYYPIEFKKQGPGHNLDWNLVPKETKKKCGIQISKKLVVEQRYAHPSHGNCYGRGYTALLGRFMVPPGSSHN